MISGPGTAGYPTAGIAGPGTNSGAGAAAGGAAFNWAPYAIGAAGVSATGNLVAGLFGFFAGENAQAIYESRARMIRDEAENDALLYREKVQRFKASQKVAYLKAGVQLSGSPLDVLDETIRVGRETESAIRATGAARALDARAGGQAAATAGRNALVSGVAGGVRTAAAGAYAVYQHREAGKARNNTPTGY